MSDLDKARDDLCRAAEEFHVICNEPAYDWLSEDALKRLASYASAYARAKKETA